MNKDPVVCVVVLNWNNAAVTIRCLESLLMSEYSDLHLVICDNGSTDASLDRIESWARVRAIACMKFDKEDVLNHYGSGPDVRLTLIQNGENLGYARGNNVGIRFALRHAADYVLVLNNDTTVSPTAIANLVTFGLMYPDAALMAPKIMQATADGYQVSEPDGWLRSPKLSACLIPAWLTLRIATSAEDVSKELPFRIYYAPGCAMMFHSETFAQVGLFDEMTFLYYEEFIMAEKLKRANLITYYVPDAVVNHLHGATTSKITPAHKYIHAVKSQKYYFSQYQATCWLALAALSMKVTFAYLYRAIRDPRYRRNLMFFFRNYYFSAAD